MKTRQDEYKELFSQPLNKKAYTFHSENLKILDVLESMFEKYKERLNSMGINVRFKDRRDME